MSRNAKRKVFEQSFWLISLRKKFFIRTSAAKRRKTLIHFLACFQSSEELLHFVGLITSLPKVGESFTLRPAVGQQKFWDFGHLKCNSSL